LVGVRPWRLSIGQIRVEKINLFRRRQHEKGHRSNRVVAKGRWHRSNTMISNYHTASSGPESDYYYTFGGGFNDDPTPHKTTSSNAGSQNAKPSHGTAQSNANHGAAMKQQKKGVGRLRRGFGWGRGNQNVKKSNNNNNTARYGGSSDTVSGESYGGQSLTYSAGSSMAGSSMYSMGESTHSSGFSRMLKVLDAEDSKNIRVGGQGGSNKSHKRLTSAGQSVASSLYYSDSDASTSRMSRGAGGMSQRSLESTDYSTDAESQLEGFKLIQMLTEE
jgi:hypothetical protein